MKNSLKKLLLGGAAILALGVGSDALAQNTDNDDVAATATVVQAITVTAVETLDFGTFIAPVGAGSITIDSDATPDNSSTTDYSGIGGASFLVTAGTPGSVEVVADDATAFSLTVGTITNLTGPGTDMAISNVTIAGAAPGAAGVNAAVNTTDDVTAREFEVGADLAVAAGQAGGTYTGSVNIIATYD